MKNNLKNKRVLITGGTSGLGRALAIELSSLGAKVAVLARTESKIQELTKTDSNIIGIQGDVSDKKNIYPLAGEVHTLLGGIDILINCASYLGQTPLRLLIDTECEDFELVLQTNVLGPFRLTKVLLPTMLLQEHGVVVNISSDAATNAYPTWGAYSVSKAALDHPSQIFDVELKDQGVHFLAIDPGDMNTPMHAAALPDADPASLRDPSDSAKKIIQILNEQDFTKVRKIL